MRGWENILYERLRESIIWEDGRIFSRRGWESILYKRLGEYLEERFGDIKDIT